MGELPLSPAERFALLQESLGRVRAIVDPIQRQLGILHEAQLLGIGAGEYKAILSEQANRGLLHAVLLEKPLGKLVSWLGSLSLFKLLEYVGKLAVLPAMGSFLLGIPQRTREAQLADLRVVEAARGTVYSKARLLALEHLGQQCVSLEGLDARRADLQGLRLEPCFDSALGEVLGAWAPEVFSRRAAFSCTAPSWRARNSSRRAWQGWTLSGANLAAPAWPRPTCRVPTVPRQARRRAARQCQARPHGAFQGRPPGRGPQPRQPARCPAALGRPARRPAAAHGHGRRQCDPQRPAARVPRGSDAGGIVHFLANVVPHGGASRPRV